MVINPAFNTPAVIKSAVNPSPVPKVLQFQFPLSSFPDAHMNPLPHNIMAFFPSKDSKIMFPASSVYQLEDVDASLFFKMSICPSNASADNCPALPNAEARSYMAFRSLVSVATANTLDNTVDRFLEDKSRSSVQILTLLLYSASG